MRQGHEVAVQSAEGAAEEGDAGMRLGAPVLGAQGSLRGAGTGVRARPRRTFGCALRSRTVSLAAFSQARATLRARATRSCRAARACLAQGRKARRRSMKYCRSKPSRALPLGRASMDHQCACRADCGRQWLAHAPKAVRSRAWVKWERATSL